MHRRSRMAAARPSALLLALAAVTALQLLGQPAAAATSSARKLLQPFNLGLAPVTRTAANAGRAREARLNALNNGAIAAFLDSDPGTDKEIVAGSSQNTLGSNLDFGGAAKGIYQSETETDRQKAQTSQNIDARSIGQAGFGLTASKAVQQSTSLAQKRIAPAGPDRSDYADTESSSKPPFRGPNDNRPLGAWEVLTTTARDYGWAGDYDYSLVTGLIDKGTGYGNAGTYDYDYGQPRPIPETAVVSGSTKTNLNNPAGRAAAFGRVKTEATAPNAVARQEARSAGVWGTTAARQNDDIFGTGRVFIPPNPFRNGGAIAAGAGRGTTNKFQAIPAIAVHEGNAGTTISRNYITGAASDQLNYVAGTQSTSVRSENIALGGQENIDFDVAGRRRQ